ncbi:hypothetical protein [Roseateles sp.]|uniref:hypothetical protein n=1 Tax=Roseateles sp. TaxID=1971397 RepID=UPI00393B35C6
MISRVVASVQKSMSGGNCADSQANSANMLRPKLATARASSRWMLAPTTGPMTAASRPPKAIVRPAHSEV